MKVGVPEEVMPHEFDVGLAAGAVRENVVAGHRVIVETKGSAGSWRNRQQLSQRREGRSCERTRSPLGIVYLAPEPRGCAWLKQG